MFLILIVMISVSVDDTDDNPDYEEEATAFDTDESTTDVVETFVDIDVQPTRGALQENADGESAEVSEQLEADANDDNGAGAERTGLVEKSAGVESACDENKDGEAEPSTAEPKIKVQARKDKKNMCP